MKKDKPFITAFVRDVFNDYATEDITYGRLVEILNEKAIEWHKEKLANENKDWDDLKKICGDPKKWLKVYSEYSDMLTRDDVAGFWQEQYNICNAERSQSKSMNKPSV